MEWVEIEGATRAEAEAKALERFGVSDLESLEIEEVKVIRKFLGMGGRVCKLKVRLKEEEPEAAVEREEIVEEPVSAPEPEPERLEEEEPEEERVSAPPDDIVTMESKYRPWVSGGPGGVVIPRSKRRRAYGGKLYNPEPFAEEAEEEAAVVSREAEEAVEEERGAGFEEEFVPAEYEDAEDSIISEETKRRAVEFVRQVLKDMGFEGEARGFRLADRLLIQISSDSGGLLIGRKGETLESLQYLVDIIINRKLEHRVRIVLDTEHYRERRKFNIYKKAKQAADDAVRTRRPVPMAPMNPAERRVVHMALADDPRVETKSEGEGTRRRVVVRPVGVSSNGRGGSNCPSKGFHHGGGPRRRR